MTAKTAHTEPEIEDVDLADPDAAPADVAPFEAARHDPAGRLARWPFLRAGSPVPTVAGLVVAGVGFVVILIGWGQAAGETAVALQLPYVVSGGIVGLGLVMVGLAAVTVQAKRADAAVLQRQMEELTAILSDVAIAVSPKPEGGTR